MVALQRFASSVGATAVTWSKRLVMATILPGRGRGVGAGCEHRAVPTRRRRTDPARGAAAVRDWAADPAGADRETVGTAVRFTLEELAARAPGSSVEVR